MRFAVSCRPVRRTASDWNGVVQLDGPAALGGRFLPEFHALFENLLVDLEHGRILLAEDVGQQLFQVFAYP